MLAEIFAKAFSACVEWTNTLFEVTGARGLVVSAFILSLCVSLFIMPLRGPGVGNIGDIADFTQNVIHQGKHQSGNFVSGNRMYKGKFARNNVSSKQVRKARHTTYYAGGSGKR